MLADRYLLFGEWLYARHTVYYRQLPHYFFEFDIFDKEEGIFLDLAGRQKLLAGTGIVTVPVIHQGSISERKLAELIGASLFASEFCHPENWHHRQSDGRFVHANRSRWTRNRSRKIRQA